MDIQQSYQGFIYSAFPTWCNFEYYRLVDNSKMIKNNNEAYCTIDERAQFNQRDLKLSFHSKGRKPRTIMYCIFSISFRFIPIEIFLFEQKDDFVVAIKVIAKKNISKTQNLLAKEIKILKVSSKYLQLLFNKK